MSTKINENLRNECQVALDVLIRINLAEDVRNNLAWCIGSYDHDKNPVGLHEYGVVALEELKTFKERNPRKVAKKILDGLEASLRNYEASLN